MFMFLRISGLIGHTFSAVPCDCQVLHGELQKRASTEPLYDMIYPLTAIGLPPGGSSSVHIYTQTIHRTTQNKQYTE